MKEFRSPDENFAQSMKDVGFVPKAMASDELYRSMGFKCGLEVHQQLETKKKLFCHCPSGRYQGADEFDAEIVRHMRPTLSELGEYDGTALMEFKTRKNIFYRLRNDTACTYEFDDTPPFLLNREALKISMEIALLLKTSVVGEVHITRKQYLDGSIPTGFQRTAIIGINGHIPIRNKEVEIIQISLEEDSCREVSDIRHDRVYRTDRLGMPLIEAVTGPDLATPGEAHEAGQYIRFLTRSTGKVRTGIGAARQDVNVSINGGRRVEIKGVSRISEIPKLTHNEAFRQQALLHIRDELAGRFKKNRNVNIQSVDLTASLIRDDWIPLKNALERGFRIVAVRLKGFRSILSHFTGPGRMFADEIEERLKVIACLESPFMTHSEKLNAGVPESLDSAVRSLTRCEKADAWILIWGPKEDIPTAMETIQERCQLAFEGVPDETRKAMPDGTTIFERVLPGPNRMYPDTDSAPIAVSDSEIDMLRSSLPEDVSVRVQKLDGWHVPQDTYGYIFRRNLFPLLETLVEKFHVDPVLAGVFLGHRLKYLEGHFTPSAPFHHERILDLFQYVKDKGMNANILPPMLRELYQHPNMDFDSILSAVGYQKTKPENIYSQIPILVKKFQEIRVSDQPAACIAWVMGQLHQLSLGNIDLADLRHRVSEAVYA
ncbi:MAG: Glu-tRNA(Gln) amidotransferase GatDE subunit E [Acidobacteria bacterium]|nr:MAG: Glu-tRNA(Gln) amidotransferase GatDE subunit E [Acidobacteriota bacterium]